MRNNDWEKAQKPVDEFRAFFGPSKIDIFREEGPIASGDLWKNNGQYPCAEHVGVYFIFDNNKKLLYIGKASASSSIGRRLWTYFKDDPKDDKKWVKAKGCVWENLHFTLLLSVLKKWGWVKMVLAG